MDFLVHHLLRTSAARWPEKEALIHKNDRLSYQAVDEQTNRLANSLCSLGVKRGERVGIFLDHSATLVLSIFSLAKAGGVFVPISPLLFPEQVQHIVNDCGMVGLISTSAKLETLRQVCTQTPSLRFVISTDGVAAVPDIPQVHRWGDLLLPASCQAPQDGCIEKDMAAILYTSGSTGKPKGVVLSHANLLAGSSIVSKYLEITAQERILSIMPLSFDYGLNQILTTFQHGATAVMMSFHFPNEIVQILVEEQITGLAGVPTLWSLLAQPRSSIHRQSLPHLRYITNTGGVMPREILDALCKALPTTRIYLMYGLTEAFRSTYLPPEELDRRPNSIGKAIPDTEIFVINEQGELCQPGEIGELVHRGPTVSLGYWGQPETTQQVLRPHPFLPPEIQQTEKVCYSGDLVKMDEDGFLYFVGRRDTLIKCSGHRISPSEVEAVLFQTGKVRGAAVIGIPDGITGQAIKAFVVPQEQETLHAGELIEFCAQKMPRYMVPAQLEILPELPKTSNGKVDYPALRRREGL